MQRLQVLRARKYRAQKRSQGKQTNNRAGGGPRRLRLRGSAESVTVFQICSPRSRSSPYEDLFLV